MDILDVSVRALSVALVALFLFQLGNRKGSPAHVASGMACALCAAVVIVAVLYRGYARSGETHGSLYPVHLALTGLFVPVFGAAIWSGMALRRSTMSWHRLPLLHGACAATAAALLLALLAVGILSRLSH